MKATLLCTVPALLALATPLASHADESSHDALRARTLAATCANCHGTAGRALGAMPSLAGQPAAQTLQALDEFRAEQRPATIMPQIVRGYRADELRLIAEHFARQEP